MAVEFVYELRAWARGESPLSLGLYATREIAQRATIPNGLAWISAYPPTRWHADTRMGGRLYHYEIVKRIVVTELERNGG